MTWTTLEIPPRDGVSVSVDDNGLIRIMQTDLAGQCDDVVLIHPDDIPRFLVLLEKAQSRAREVLAVSEKDS